MLKKVILIGLTLFVFWGWLFFRVPVSNVSSLNKWYDTNLSEREIGYVEGGLIDASFCAQIPMTEEEFSALVRKIGMWTTRGNLQAERVWWCKRPKGEYYVLDRMDDVDHHDRIEGHYSSSNNVAYFSYLKEPLASYL